MKRTPLQYGLVTMFTLTGGCSAACTSAAIYDVFTKADNMQGAIIMGVFAAFFLIASAIAAYASFRRPAEKGVSEHEEKLTLAYAKQMGGVVSVAELALVTKMDVDRCRLVLDQMVAKNISEPDVTTKGEIVYRFPAFARAGIDGGEAGMQFDFDAESDNDLEESILAAHLEKSEQSH